MAKTETVTPDRVLADAGRYLADARRGVTTVVLEGGHALSRLRSRLDLRGDFVADLIREGRRLH